MIIPCAVSMSFCCMFESSCPSSPVSVKIVKSVAYFLLEAEMILFMFSVVGISGIFRSHLKYGFSHWIP